MSDMERWDAQTKKQRAWEKRHRERITRAEANVRSSGASLVGAVPEAKPFVKAVNEMFAVLLTERIVEMEHAEILADDSPLFGRNW